MSAKIAPPVTRSIQPVALKDKETGTSRLFKRMEDSYKNAELVLRLLNEPARSVSAITSFCWGAARIVYGGPYAKVAGLVSLVAGVTELRTLTRGEQDTLNGFLKEVHGAVRTVEAIAEIQQEHLEAVGNSFNAIGSSLQELNGELAHLEEINTHQLESIAKRKASARDLQERAAVAYKRAGKLLDEAHKNAAHATKIFQKCLNHQRLIDEISQSEKPDVRKILELSKKTFKSIKNGCAKMANFQELSKEGAKARQEGDVLKSKASREYSLALQESQQVHKRSIEVVREAQERAAQIKAAKEEGQGNLELAQQDNQDMMNVIRDLKERFRTRPRSLEFGPGEVFTGVLAGVAVTTVAGPVAGLSVGCSTSCAVRFRNYIYRAAQWMMSFVREETVVTHSMENNRVLEVVYDGISSGWWGAYVMGRGSETVGSVYINLGDPQNPRVLRFNIKKVDSVAKDELLDLIEEMDVLYRDGRLNKQIYLNFLDSLTNVHQIQGKADPAALPNHRIQILTPNDSFRAIVRYYRSQVA